MDGYEKHPLGWIKIISYRPLEQPSPPYLKDVHGCAVLEIKNGAIVNILDAVVKKEQVDAQGNPVLSKLKLSASSIEYDLHDSVEVCLKLLCTIGILANDTEILCIHSQKSKRELAIRKWSKGAHDIDDQIAKEFFEEGDIVPVQEDFVDFLKEKLDEFENSDGHFSLGSYSLKICRLYFEPEELTAHDVFNVGYFFSQMKSKFSLEDDVLRARKAQDDRKRGTLENSRLAENRRLQKGDAIIALRNQVIDEHGLSRVRIDTVAASYIRQLAVKARTPELFVSEKNDFITVDTIRNLLGGLRRDGKID